MAKDEETGNEQEEIEESRRDFLKGSAAAAGVGIAASVMPGSAAAAESDAKGQRRNDQAQKRRRPSGSLVLSG